MNLFLFFKTHKFLTKCVFSFLIFPFIFTILYANAENTVLAKTVSDVLTSVVYIAVDKQDANFSTQVTGEGFVNSENGYVVSAASLVNESTSITVTLNDKREFKANIIGIDNSSNLALLKIDVTGLSPAKIGEPQKLKVNETVFAIREFPDGLVGKFSEGIVSNKQMQKKSFYGFLQTTVPLNLGMGGGPLFSTEGKVIGINMAIYSPSTKKIMSFAIPIDAAMNVASELRQNGRVQHGTLGLMLEEVDASLAKAFKISNSTGALVNEAKIGMPAALAGIVKGDIILRIANQTVAHPNEVSDIVRPLKPGTTVTVEVMRKRNKRLEKLDLVVAEATN